MLVCILVLALLAPVAFLPLALASFTPSALDEMGVCLICHSSCKKCFSSSWRAKQKNSFGRLNTKPFKNFRVLKRNLNHLSYLV